MFGTTVFLLVLVCISGCKTVVQGSSDTPLEYIEFTRKACTFEMDCREYTLRIHKNNKALLDRKAGFDVLGRFEGRVDATPTFWQVVDSANIFGMEDSYHLNAEDTQEREIVIDDGKKVKKVQYKMMMPHSLRDIEMRMDKFVDRTKWSKME